MSIYIYRRVVRSTLFSFDWTKWWNIRSLAQSKLKIGWDFLKRERATRSSSRSHDLNGANHPITPRKTSNENGKVSGISIYLSFYLSLSIYLYLSITLSLHLSLHLSITLSLYLSISIYLSITPSIYSSIYHSITLSLYLSITLSLYLSIHLYLSINLYL